MAAKKNLSIEEILAACRQTDGEAGAAASTESPPAAEAPAESSAPTQAPAAPSAAPEATAQAEHVASSGVAPQDARKMSVAEMLAAARGEKSAAPKPAKPAAKPASKPAAAAKDKTSPKPPAAGPRDTSSILAAARKSVKPGPMSKAEAAKQEKSEPKGKPKIAVPAMPEKPAYAVATQPKPASDEHRRGFMAVLFGSALAVGFCSLAAISGLWTLGLARFLFPNILTEPPSRFKVGFPGDFSPDTVATKFKAQFGVWVVNTAYEGEQQITALKSVCTHLGCTPNWLEGEQKFKCPCHGSGFYKDGINFEGPAPRPLERYAITVADDGQIEIDKSKKFQQEMGQWGNPSSFVSV